MLLGNEKYLKKNKATKQTYKRNNKQKILRNEKRLCVIF